MQPHTVNYFNHFGYGPEDFIECEIPNCNQKAVDIHHIIPRSKFGKKRKDEQDDITNLIGLCRAHHDDAHNNILTKEYLQSLTLAR